MSSKVLCFGDSWAAGAELRRSQHPFVHWFAQELGISYVNWGKQGSSLGIILHTIISNLSTINCDDIVLVIIPPDARWYDENEHNGFYTVTNSQRDDYFKFLNSKTTEWFKYHHALFIYSIQKILDDIGCCYILAHNYGQISETNKYGLKINYNSFLSSNNLTAILSDCPDEWFSYPDHVSAERKFDEDGPTTHYFTGKYFAGCRWHPNELGHQEIARLLLKKYHEINRTKVANVSTC